MEVGVSAGEGTGVGASKVLVVADKGAGEGAGADAGEGIELVGCWCRRWYRHWCRCGQHPHSCLVSLAQMLVPVGYGR